ncbi:hypothetical protein HNR44_002324 [Geomicrobium halophilum]|uniref:Uncharacterized protein n=1 Tax=Geomicrobium halophilum TaxID=549000 RepID=A0A841PVJ1_9BACL|nr:hypothetical protein [Geomicrobium halophilum]MBB6450341.1 hypothetical protein [Geomicrobium halophilum]
MQFLFSVFTSIVPFGFVLTIPGEIAFLGFLLYAFIELFRKYSDIYIVFFIFSVLTLSVLAYVFTFVIRKNGSNPVNNEAVV